MPPQALDLARAQLALRALQSEELPHLACQLLELGLDSPSLRALAGWTRPIMSDVGPAFECATRELGLDPLERRDALRVIARHFAQQIADGHMDPYEGAHRIWSGVAGEYQPFEEVSPFVGLASQIDDYRQMARTEPETHGRYIEECLQDIRSEARAFLSRGS